MSRYDNNDYDYHDESDQLESSIDGDTEDGKQRAADVSRSNTLVGELEEPRPANYAGQTLYSKISFSWVPLLAHCL